MGSSTPDEAAIYLGAAGTTRTTTVHYACSCRTAFVARVYRSVDVSANPDLRARAMSADPEDALTTARCPGCDRRVWVSIPFTYHDPKHWLFALVLPDAFRHRALTERAALLSELAADPAAVPDYVSRFEVVFGPQGLAALVEAHAGRAESDARAATRDAELERTHKELESARDELDDLTARLDEQRARLDARRGELDRLAAELERRDLALGERTRRLDEREQEIDRQTAELAQRMKAIADIEDKLAQRLDDAPADARTDELALFDRAELDDDERPSRAQEPHTQEVDPEDLLPGDDTDRVRPAAPRGRRSRRRARSTDDEVTNTAPVGDFAIERWIATRETTLKLVTKAGKVRIAVCVEAEELDNLLADDLELRVQLHRFPSFPLVILALGTPGSLRGLAGTREPIAIPFDISAEPDRAVLGALAAEFAFTLELYDTDYLAVSRRPVRAPLAGNVRYVLAAADEHAARIDPHDRSFGKAAVALAAPGYDRYGWHHPERAHLDEDALADLATPEAVRRALAVAARLSEPEREDYLFLIRGYPVDEWNARRRAVLERAVELGLWMGAPLAQIAVSEGLARSRKDLVTRLQKRFGEHLAAAGAGPGALSDAAIRDNWAELRREAGALGLPSPDAPSPGRNAGAPRERDSDSEPMVSGTIPGAPLRDLVAAGMGNRSVDELLAALDEPDHRLDAALELARRGERRAIEPVLAAAQSMPRGEAVRVLGYAVSFGDRATGPLIRGLQSHKGYVRQGCALALSVLKNEEAVEALAELLIAEPTAIWKEVARAIGQVGPRAIMPLASRLGDGDKGVLERLAWALAHIVARGGRAQVETLARGRDPVAAGVASHALELSELARSDDLQVRGNHTPRDQTVNRAFSRRFFQALEASAPIVQPQELPAGADTSAPAMMLDEADLLEATDLDEEPEVLDDKDLIPT